MAITNAQQYKQLVNPPLDGKSLGSCSLCVAVSGFAMSSSASWSELYS